MIEFRILTKNDEKILDDCINEIEKTIENHDWWLPIHQKEKNLFLDENRTVFLGAFDKDKLIGASALSLKEEDFSQYSSLLGFKAKFGKLGRSMVLPEYRGNNYMYQMNSYLTDIAKKQNYDYLLTIAHPENIASISSLKKLGMKKVKEFIKDKKYLRNIFLLDLKNK